MHKNSKRHLFWDSGVLPPSLFKFVVHINYIYSVNTSILYSLFSCSHID
jgi:hypothetical protein